MSEFCRHIQKKLYTKVTDDSNMWAWTSVLQFSWNGTMLHIAVTLCSNFLHLVTLSQRAPVRLGLHVAIFFNKYLWTIPQKKQI